MKCKACGSKLKLTNDRRYVVVKHSIADLLTNPVAYECFDCQRCGCQNIVNVREGETANEFVPTSD